MEDSEYKDDSEAFSLTMAARYRLRKDLGLSDNELNEDIKGWSECLEKKLNATSVFEGYIVDPDSEEFRIPAILELPDIDARISAMNEIGELYKESKSVQLKNLLMKVYIENDSQAVKVLAKDFLGYSD